MPDLLTHLFIGLITCEVFKIKRKSLVLLGTILPDIILKITLIGYFLKIPENLKYALLPLHSPLGLVLLTIIIISFFKYNRTRAFLLITIGWVSHIILDLTNKHFLISQSQLMFPLSMKDFELGLLWPEQYYIILLPTLTIYGIIRLTKRYKNLLEYI